MTLLTFIIPVRHQDNAKDWPLLKSNLRQTMASIANQTHADWRGIVVANEGADLPEMPEGFSALRVDFPPNNMHELQKGPLEDVLDAFRFDKGRRVLSGMLSAPDARFFMIVDDDDFVSCDIAGHVAAHPEANGWFVDQGFLWGDGGDWVFATDDFHLMCGTSLIIRADLYGLPASLEAADVDWMKDMLGSHQRIKPALAERGTPLAPLPFAGAVYRIGHAGAHSQSRGLWRKTVLNKKTLKQPRLFFENIRRLHKLRPDLRQRFFGTAA
jgi:hypothetical protein